MEKLFASISENENRRKSPFLVTPNFRSWPVPPFQSTRIVGSRITGLRYRAEQGHTEPLIAVVDPNETLLFSENMTVRGLVRILKF